jgi:hypothetical protein
MATTPTYSWPLPDDTDLVKDGAEAIRDLGNAIDTTVSTTGLVHIETQTFSAVSGFSFSNDVFTSDFRNYKIVIELAGASISGACRLRLRAGGSDNATSNYNLQRLISFGTTVSSSRITSATQWELFSINTARASYVLNLISPQVNIATGVLISSLFLIDGTNCELGIWNGNHDATTQFDSLSVLSTGANITGNMSVYGYKD